MFFWVKWWASLGVHNSSLGKLVNANGHCEKASHISARRASSWYSSSNVGEYQPVSFIQCPWETLQVFSKALLFLHFFNASSWQNTHRNLVGVSDFRCSSQKVKVTPTFHSPFCKGALDACFEIVRTTHSTFYLLRVHSRRVS